MAVLKHIASKNKNYTDAINYLLFQHDEVTHKAILDEQGRMMLREEYYMNGINCEPMLFDEECEKLNDEVKEKSADARRTLKETEAKIREANEQIHYTGQYLANKSVYSQFLKSRSKKKFRQEHRSEIELYEAAVKFLKGKNPDGKIPSMKILKAEKENLEIQEAAQQKTYDHFRDYQKELRTVCTNVDALLGRGQQNQERDQSLAK